MRWNKWVEGGDGKNLIRYKYDNYTHIYMGKRKNLGKKMIN